MKKDCYNEDEAGAWILWGGSSYKFGVKNALELESYGKA